MEHSFITGQIVASQLEGGGVSEAEETPQPSRVSLEDCIRVANLPFEWQNQHRVCDPCNGSELGQFDYAAPVIKLGINIVDSGLNWGVFRPQPDWVRMEIGKNWLDERSFFVTSLIRSVALDCHPSSRDLPE